MSDQEVHEVGVAHCVHRGNDDGVELGILRDGGHVMYSLRPQLPSGTESKDRLLYCTYNEGNHVVACNICMYTTKTIA